MTMSLYRILHDSKLQWSFKVIFFVPFSYLRLTSGHWELLPLNWPRESHLTPICTPWEFCFLFQKTILPLLLETLLSLLRSLSMLVWIKTRHLWVYIAFTCFSSVRSTYGEAGFSYNGDYSTHENCLISIQDLLTQILTSFSPFFPWTFCLIPYFLFILVIISYFKGERYLRNKTHFYFMPLLNHMYKYYQWFFQLCCHVNYI